MNFECSCPDDDITTCYQYHLRPTPPVTQGRGIKTTPFSTGTEGIHLMTENKHERYIWIGKIFYICCISKENFRPCGMAPSEWKRSMRVVRGTPVADYSMPGINNTRHVAYCHPLAVSLFLPALLVFYFKRTLWRCGKLWWYVRMGSLGTHLHHDCNAMGDTAKISRPIPSTCTRNAIITLLIIHIIQCRQMYVAIDNPSHVPSISCLTTSSRLWNYMRAANNVSHADNLWSNGCWCVSHLYKVCDGIKVSEFSGIAVSARADQYSMKAPSSFRCLILNSLCSCHRRSPLSAP